ncbi:DnaJ sub C member 7 [Branchiostoma belcheri]|nr:DnaJ sub C member 7 [Branchiostoma belcheri]
MSTTTELADDKENAERLKVKIKRPTKRRSDDGVGGHQKLTNSKAWSSASRNVSSDHSEKRLRFESSQRAAGTPQTPRSTRLTTLNNHRKAMEAAKLGNTLINCGQHHKALNHFNTAVELCPTFASFYSGRCECYIAMGLFADALVEARQATEVDGKFVTGYQRQAECLLALGRPAEAVKAYTAALEQRSGDEELSKALKSAREISQFQLVVERDLHKGASRHLVFYVDKMTKTVPLCTKYKVMKAELLIGQKKYADALTIVEEVLKVDKTADALYIRGLCLHYSGDEDGSQAMFNGVLDLEPDHKRTLAFLEMSCQLASKKEEGNVSFKSGEYQKAYDLYTEALTIDPENKLTNAKLYNNRAAVCVKLGRLNDAIRDCTQAIELDPSYIKAISRRATCYMETECFEEAIRDFETLYKLNPTPENEKLLREARREHKSSMQTDFYKILGVERFATTDEIKRAYRKLALKCHPDKHAGASEDEKIAMEKKFKAIGEAHQTLSDPVEKAQYDRELRQIYLGDKDNTLHLPMLTRAGIRVTSPRAHTFHDIGLSLTQDFKNAILSLIGANLFTEKRKSGETKLAGRPSGSFVSNSRQHHIKELGRRCRLSRRALMEVTAKLDTTERTGKAGETSGGSQSHTVVTGLRKYPPVVIESCTTFTNWCCGTPQRPQVRVKNELVTRVVKVSVERTRLSWGLGALYLPALAHRLYNGAVRYLPLVLTHPGKLSLALLSSRLIAGQHQGQGKFFVSIHDTYNSSSSTAESTVSNLHLLTWVDFIGYRQQRERAAMTSPPAVFQITSGLRCQAFSRRAYHREIAVLNPAYPRRAQSHVGREIGEDLALFLAFTAAKPRFAEGYDGFRAVPKETRNILSNTPEIYNKEHKLAGMYTDIVPSTASCFIPANSNAHTDAKRRKGGARTKNDVTQYYKQDLPGGAQVDRPSLAFRPSVEMRVLRRAETGGRLTEEAGVLGGPVQQGIPTKRKRGRGHAEKPRATGRTSRQGADYNYKTRAQVPGPFHPEKNPLICSKIDTEHDTEWAVGPGEDDQNATEVESSV